MELKTNTNMHPLHKFMFCPSCGSRRFEIQNEKSKRCCDCGFEYYINPSGATAVFIVNERGEILINRRAKEPAQGTLDLPGGFMDMNETIEECLYREIKEETGLEICESRYLFSIPNLYLYSGMNIPTIDCFFECRVKGCPEVTAADDAAECMWMCPEDIDPKQIGLRSIRMGVERFLMAIRSV